MGQHMWLFKMFKKRLRRQLLQLEILNSIATAIVLLRIAEKEILSGSYSEVDEIEQRKLAAICNYLLGRDFQEMHRKEFSLDEIETNAWGYLDGDSKLCELVVQSLRASNLAMFYKHNDVSVRGSKTLERYGALVPDSPTPESYFVLVLETLSALNNRNRIEVINHVATTWPNFYKYNSASFAKLIEHK